MGRKKIINPIDSYKKIQSDDVESFNQLEIGEKFYLSINIKNNDKDFNYLMVKVAPKYTPMYVDCYEYGEQCFYEFGKWKKSSTKKRNRA